MRVFLTGASGFVGSFFLRSLLSSGRHTVAILLRNAESAWRIRDLLEQVCVIEGKLENPSYFENQVKDFCPDAFVHSAWGGVFGSDRNALSQWRNVQQSLELVEMSARLGAQHWMGIGSQAEYGPHADRITVSSATNPTTLYGASKLATCLLAERLCNEYGMRFSWIRLFSPYGPMDSPHWMIPYLIGKLLKGEKPSLTKGEQLWDYLYIEDAAAALSAVLESETASGIFNLGSGAAFTLKTIIEKIRDLVNPELQLGFGEVPYRADQVMHLEADISRLNMLTGWVPGTSLDLGLRNTVAWYREHNEIFG